MPTSPKSFTVLSSEKKSHRTKSELKQRKQGEDALLSGKILKERPCVRIHPVAHKEFKRINELLTIIGKNDAMYETIINRYCQIQGECADYEESIKSLSEDLEKLLNTKTNMEPAEYFNMKIRIEKAIDLKDNRLQTKRRMLFDLEKENCLTIAAALRNIPKKVENKKSALREALGCD